MDPMDLVARIISTPILMVEVLGGLLLLTIIATITVRRGMKPQSKETAHAPSQEGRWSELTGAKVFSDGAAYMVLFNNSPLFLYAEPPGSIIAPIAEAFKDLPSSKPVHLVDPKRNCRNCMGLGKPEGAWGSEAAIGKCLFNQGKFIFKPVSDCQRYEEAHL